MCFVDFASAFDSVDRDSLWRIMAADGIPPILLRLIKAYYSSTKMKVRTSGSDSMPFEIRSSEAWSTQLVMPARPVPDECRRKYKYKY